MTIAFASAFSHAPGMMAWRDAAPPEARDRIFASLDELKRRVAEARLDAVILFAAEHWANFFYDHMSPYCVGRAAAYPGPVEPWMKMDKVMVPGDPALAEEILAACYENEIDPGFTHDMALDHGTMIPLHFLTPGMDVPIVPIMVNTLAAPQPPVARCFKMGRVVGEVARRSPKRIGLIASGGMSHDPGERNHGIIHEDFDRAFLQAMEQADLERLKSYTVADLAARGAGTIELLNWIALAAALGSYKGETLTYELVPQWATGMGVMAFSA